MQIPEKILYVDSSFHEVPGDHEYNNLQRAIDSIPDWGRYMIMLSSDLLGIRTLDLHGRNIIVKINGQSEYGITFAENDPICVIGEDRFLKFINMKYVRGGDINIRFSGGKTGFYNCESVITTIILEGGKYTNCYICDTKLYGTDGHPAIVINHPDSKLYIRDSFIKGGYHSPALYFDNDSIRKVRIVNSTILHYDVGNSAIVNGGTYNIGIRAYNCNGNDHLCHNDIINYINTYDNNTIDPEIDY